MKMPKILCFDVESSGLHGEGFAVGAVLLDEDGAEVDTFVGRAPIDGPVDGWVAKNVLPAMAGMPENCANARELRAAFFEWFVARKEGVIVIADCGWPVEARFLAACVDDAPALRGWDGPYPLHDVATLLLAAGMAPTGTYLPDPAPPGQKHHPLYDARCSAQLARRVLAGFWDGRSVSWP